MPVYKVQNIDRPPSPDPEWNKKPWTSIKPISLNNHLGNRPEHFPGTRAKIAYDRNAIHLIFEVKDHYITSKETSDQNAVCQDSCVEFFFTPGHDPAKGYFNIETNCIGTRLIRFQTAPEQNKTAMEKQHLQLIKTFTSMHRATENEIPGPVTWSVQHTIPMEALEPYYEVLPPAPGISWRANFYKCADDSSHPHWLCWAPVTTGKFSYHAPQCFGELLMI